MNSAPGGKRRAHRPGRDGQAEFTSPGPRSRRALRCLTHDSRCPMADDKLTTAAPISAPGTMKWCCAPSWRTTRRCGACMVIRPMATVSGAHAARAGRHVQGHGARERLLPLFIPRLPAQGGRARGGLCPEAAVVTHGGGQKLAEPLVVRPTSETIIYSMYAKWVQSYRDLPILINQWANVVRWEMRASSCGRSEFLWQEGDTAHATHAEAEAEARLILGLYREFMEQWMAMPVITGVKTPSREVRGRQAFNIDLSVRFNLFFHCLLSPLNFLLTVYNIFSYKIHKL